MIFFKWLKRKFFPRHLLARFILIILLPLVILQAMVGIYFFNKHWDTISRRLANDVIGEIRLWIKSNSSFERMNFSAQEMTSSREYALSRESMGSVWMTFPEPATTGA